MNETGSSKKRIGIITIFRSNNYGAVLQAFALECFLREQGFDAEVIDYNEQDRELKFQSPIRRIRHLLWHRLIYNMLGGLRRTRKTAAFIAENFHLSPKRYSSRGELADAPPAYDIYITGSDQVWNPFNTNNDPSYFLSFAPKSSRRISYAASFGLEALPAEFHAEYNERLHNYDLISVREREARNLVRELSGLDAELVLDPTLLLSADDWNRFAAPPVVSGKYILCYYMLNRPINREEMRIAGELAKRTGWKVIHLGLREYRRFLPWENHIVDAGVREFLSLVAHASFVVTNSFHGCAFSINYRKPFLAVTSKTHPLKSRIETLLETMELKDRLHYIEDALPDLDGLSSLDYSVSEARIRKEQTESRAFLLKALSNEK